MDKPALVVLAAGIGSRFGGIKQLKGVGPNEEAILEYSVYDALRAGFGQVVFVIKDEIEREFREQIGCHFEDRTQVDYVFQELDALPEGVAVPAGRKKPWGTGHAILCCQRVVRAPFAVINADDLYGTTSYVELCRYLQQAQDGEAYDYCLVGFRLVKTLSEHGTVSRGVCEMVDGVLRGIAERTRVQRRDGRPGYWEDDDRTWRWLPEDSVASMNMFGLTPSIFGELQTRFAEFLRLHGSDPKAEFYIPTVVGELLAEGKATVTVIPSDETWYGMTYGEDLEVVRGAIAEMIRCGIYPGPLRQA